MGLPQFTSFLLQNFIRQRELDDRWRHLASLTKDETKKPFDEMVSIYAKA